MQELFIGIKLTDTSSSNAPLNQCPVCLQPLIVAKVLKCGHMICVVCVFHLYHQKTTSVICPLDKTETLANNGDVKNVPTKFFVKLKCDKCNRSKSFHKSWWCDTCSSTYCSDCAMRFHRVHECQAWDDFRVIEDCYNFYRQKSTHRGNFDKIRQRIQQLCSELEKQLIAKVDQQESVCLAEKIIENSFGALVNLSHNDHAQQEDEAHSKVQSEEENKKMDKKINAVSNLIPKIFSHDFGPVSLPTKVASASIHVPPVAEVVGFCETYSKEEMRRKRMQQRNSFLFGDTNSACPTRQVLSSPDCNK